MQNLEHLKRQIGNAEDLQGVARTMKTLAAVSIRQYETAAESLAQYQETLELGLQMLLWHTSDVPAVPQAGGARQRIGAIVFGSDQGMCGQFNEQIASYAMQVLTSLAAEPGNRSVLAVGRRAAGRLIDAGQPLEGEWEAPTSVSGITGLVQDLLTEIDQWRTRERLERILLLYNRRLSAASFEPGQYQLLPLAQETLADLRARPLPTRTLPMFTIERSRLVSAVIRQLLFAALFRGCTESLAAENASRIASMQAAERNIARQLDELRMQYHQQRQTAVTEELLDVATGFEALTQQDRPRGKTASH